MDPPTSWNVDHLTLVLPTSFACPWLYNTLQELFYEGPNTLRNLCKATRGILPTIKWRTQEKSSVLGDIMETKQSKVGGICKQGLCCP
jgi:hypothetical protein